MRSRRTSGAEASGLIEATRLSSGRRVRLEDILDRVVPHFERYPLLSSKRVRLRSVRVGLPTRWQPVRTCAATVSVEIVELVSGDESERAPALRR